MGEDYRKKDCFDKCCDNHCCEPHCCESNCCCNDNQGSGIWIIILIVLIYLIFCNDNKGGGLFGGLF